MKKTLAAILAVAAVLSTTACGAKNDENAVPADATVKEDSADKKETTKKTKEETTKAEEEETTAVTEEEKSDFVPYIDSSNRFRNGSWYFTAKDENNKSVKYLYNIAENKLIKVSENISSSPDDISGNLIYTYEGVYDAETGEAYVEFKDYKKALYAYDSNGSGDTVYFKDHMIFITDKEESFSGNKYLLGCLSDKGEWLSDLSSDRALFKDDVYNESSYLEPLADDRLYFYNYNNSKVYFYDVLSDRLLNDPTMLYGISWYTHNPDQFYFYNNNNEYSGFAKFDVKSNKIVETLDSQKYSYYNGTNRNRHLAIENLENNNRTGKYTVINVESGEKILFDLSEYNDITPFVSYDDIIVFSCRNANNDYYTAIANASGELEFEPIKGCPSYNDFRNSDEIIVCKYYDTNFVYNKTTKTLTMGNTDSDSADYYEFVDYNAETNTLLIKTKDSETKNTRYYLADANDPMNYYSPFEK